MHDRPRVIHADELVAEEGRYPAPFDDEALSLGRDLGRASGSRTLGAWHERLLPGRRTSRLHAHRREEELIYVLSGAPLLLWQSPGGSLERIPLRAGSFVALPAGTGMAHSVHNPGPDEATLLVVGERRPGEQIAYPNDPDLEAWRTEQDSPRRWSDVQAPHPEAVKIPAFIETERLLLRCWTPFEIDEMSAVVRRNQQHLLPWMPWASPEEPQTPEHYRGLVERWSVGVRDGSDVVYRAGLRDGRFVGGAGYHARVGPKAWEVGYWIDQDQAGQGLVTEWVAAQSRIAFALGLLRLEIHHDVDNHPSGRIAERLGFRKEGVLRRRFPDATGEYKDKVVWSMFHDEQSEAVQQAACKAWDWTGRRLY